MQNSFTSSQAAGNALDLVQEITTAQFYEDKKTPLMNIQPVDIQVCAPRQSNSRLNLKEFQPERF